MAVPSEQEILGNLRTVADPEIPALSVIDLGIVRGLEWQESTLVVSVTPTYSACAAIQVIEQDILAALGNAGIPAIIRRTIAPAWTTEWLSEEAEAKLTDSGIAPPPRSDAAAHARIPQSTCPWCGSENTELVSTFGSTLCKSLYRCRACGAPFDAFKTM